MRYICVKKHKGFASFYALMIFMIVLSYTSVLVYQIQTYHKIENYSLIDIYVMRCIRNAYHTENQVYPLIMNYQSDEIIMERANDIVYAYYNQICLKVVFENDKIVDYEYIPYS